MSAKTATSTTTMGGSQPSIVDDFMYGSNVAQSHITIRLGFIRKVYGILCAQLVLTTLVSAFMMSHGGIKEFLLQNNWILVVNFLCTMVLIIALMVKRTEYPANYYLLGIFTLLEALSVGFIVSFYDVWLVVQAFVLTSMVVACLTAYTFQTKRDFKASGAILSTFLMLLLFGSLTHIIFQSETYHTVLSMLGAFLFSGFIIYDTQMIMKHLNPEEYIVGVINLYLDILNLFLEILKILDAAKRS